MIASPCGRGGRQNHVLKSRIARPVPGRMVRGTRRLLWPGRPAPAPRAPVPGDATCPKVTLLRPVASPGPTPGPAGRGGRSASWPPTAAARHRGAARGGGRVGHVRRARRCRRTWSDHRRRCPIGGAGGRSTVTRLIDIMGRASLPMDSAHSEPKPFEHVHAPKSALYRGVMRAFVEAKHRFLVHLRPEDVAEALGATESDAVEAALTSLVGWGNLRADPDTSRVTTVEDFYRPRYLYQLTREGEAAELALDAYDAALGRRGELQSVALEDIRLRLRSLLPHADASEPDAAVVHSLLRELTGLLDGLAANASAFMSGLQRTIDLQEGSEDAFIAYKDRLIGYLERFIRDLVVKTADVATTLERLDGPSMDRLLGLVAAREAGDVAPGAHPEQDAGAFVGKLADWRARWSGLCSWFVGDR